MIKDFDWYVKRSILANNDFGIKEIKDISLIKSMELIRANYQAILELLKRKDINAIKSLPDNFERTGEYLVIVKVSDQNNDWYLATIYDADELTQDPQLIEIFK